VDSAVLDEWLELLDDLDYYELLSTPRDATVDDIRAAFRTFAEAFHPDGHAGRSAADLSALDAIFKRGTEAYAVLTDPGLRARYDDKLSGGTSSRRMQTVPPSAGKSPSQSPPRLVDRVRSASARPFVARAEELVEKGDLKQARLQMVMARHYDEGNDALDDYLRFIEEEIVARK